MTVRNRFSESDRLRIIMKGELSPLVVLWIESKEHYRLIIENRVSDFVRFVYYFPSTIVKIIRFKYNDYNLRIYNYST